jgi:hypothetical protein
MMPQTTKKTTHASVQCAVSPLYGVYARYVHGLGAGPVQVGVYITTVLGCGCGDHLSPVVVTTNNNTTTSGIRPIASG